MFGRELKEERKICLMLNVRNFLWVKFVDDDDYHQANLSRISIETNVLVEICQTNSQTKNEIH